MPFVRWHDMKMSYTPPLTHTRDGARRMFFALGLRQLFDKGQPGMLIKQSMQRLWVRTCRRAGRAVSHPNSPVNKTTESQ